MVAAPFLDLIIPVHNPARPIRRAVLSAVAGMTPEVLRVTVVCHGVSAAAIAQSLGSVDRELVRLVEYSDGLGSPSGPINEGLRQATGRYVAVMGSDDFLEPGCLTSLVEHAQARKSDVVLARLRYQDGEVLRNPLVRPLRVHNLDAVRDRLFYRSAPLGLLRRDMLGELDVEFVEGMQSGGDQAVSARLWTSAASIDMPAAAPCYVIGADAGDRVTMESRSIAKIMEALVLLLEQDWVRTLPTGVRRALAIKLFRINLLGMVNARRTTEQWGEQDRRDVRDLYWRIREVSAESVTSLSRADRRLLDVLEDGSRTAADFVNAVKARRSASRLDLLLPRNPFRCLDREGTLVRYVLYRVGR